MTLLLLRIFIPHLNNSYGAGSPSFNKCTDISCDLQDSLWMSTVQACTSELVITDLLLSIDIQLMQSVEFGCDSSSAEVVNKVSLLDLHH